jgi:hypothetical protein
MDSWLEMAYEDANGCGYEPDAFGWDEYDMIEATA